MNLTPEEVRALFDYDQESGVLTWKARPSASARWNTRYAGKPAGALRDNGYIQISVHDRLYRAHRLIWALAHGCWPDADIDHINGDRADNRLCNLRAATRGENMQNTGMLPTNTSGFRGVRNIKGRWRALIQHNGKTRHIGMYATAEEAFAAYTAAKREIHEFHPTIRGV